MPTSGNIIVEGWTVLDVNSDPLTGVTSPAGIQLVLQRQSLSTIVAASETVTWTEIAATGRYYFSFTPVNSGFYILYGKELHASSLGRAFEFRWSVSASGAAFSPSFTNAFCAQSDMERWLTESIDGSKTPNDVEAAAFAETVAAVLMAICAKRGLTVTPTTVTAGSRLEDILREANAIGATLRYLIAREAGKSPSLGAKPERLQMLWLEYVGDPENGLLGILNEEITGNLASLMTDHVISGDTLAVAETAPTATSPFGVSMGDLF